MARAGLAPQTPAPADAPRADERAPATFGAIQGGPLIHWMVQEQRG